MSDIIDYAIRMADAGVSVCPAIQKEKRPAGDWKKRQSERLLPESVASVFGKADAVSIVCGAISGGIEMIDMDCQAELYREWHSNVDRELPGLTADLVVERSQSGGRHIIYRCANHGRNQKLAVKQIECDPGDTADYRGKPYEVKTTPDGVSYIEPCLIETRGEGGIFLCYPTPGYRLENGSLADIKMVSDEERDTMIRVAKELTSTSIMSLGSHEYKEKPTQSTVTGDRMGDGYNLSATNETVQAVLERHGWLMSKSGDNQYWVRPGKVGGTDKGHSATLKDGVFYVFSTNAQPFDPDTPYSPFAVMALLDHAGDFKAAASQIGFDIAVNDDIDVSSIMSEVKESAQFNLPITFTAKQVSEGMVSLAGVGLLDCVMSEPKTNPKVEIKKTPYNPIDVVMEPKKLSAEMARRQGEKQYTIGQYAMPGIVGKMMEATLAHSVYPNVEVAFCGAVAMLGMMAGRKYRDENDCRTNMYIVALAESSQGKESIRTFNAKLASAVGIGESVQRKFASAEGIEDCVMKLGSVIFQVDEIQGVFEAMKSQKDSRSSSIMHLIMELYSSATKIFYGRVKAGAESANHISQPCLCFLGTSIPSVFYKSLSSTMMDNGLFSRFIVIESEPVIAGYEPGVMEIPESLIDDCKSMLDNDAGVDIVSDQTPRPQTVKMSVNGRVAITEASYYAEAQLNERLRKNKERPAVIYGKAAENIRKLALIYAISREWESPIIDAEAVHFARDIIFSSCERMIHSAGKHVTDTDDEVKVVRIREVIRVAGEDGITLRDISRQSHMKKVELQEILLTLVEQEYIVSEKSTGKGRPTTLFKFCD